SSCTARSAFTADTMRGADGVGTIVVIRGASIEASVGAGDASCADGAGAADAGCGFDGAAEGNAGCGFELGDSFRVTAADVADRAGADSPDDAPGDERASDTIAPRGTPGPLPRYEESAHAGGSRLAHGAYTRSFSGSFVSFCAKARGCGTRGTAGAFSPAGPPSPPPLSR